MKKMNFKLMALAVVFSGFTMVGCSSEQSSDSETEMDETMEMMEEAPVESNTVVDIAIGSPDHTTLVAAVTAASLVEVLSGDGPFTVFAPTNAAFAALPAGTVENLLLPENKEMLANILTYHVVAGNVMAADLSNGQKVTTVNGQELTVTIVDGNVMINGAKVVAADLVGTNGVVHVIDGVVLPK
jgi:uncharacterized surface protein with fasciclin (FAS1) repeats